MSKLSLCFILLFLGGTLHSQIQFTDRSDLMFRQDVTSGVPMGIADMDGDLKNDIVQLDNTTDLLISYQRQRDSVFSGVEVPGAPRIVNNWMMSIGDVNNDGINEILTGGAYNSVNLYFYVDSTKNYRSTNLTDGDFIFCQASNLADINNDGWLDIFICHDDGESYVWANNGDGTFRLANDLIDMRTTPVSDNSGNYGSVWTDIENDGDQDLYIAKCRQGVSDPTDPRRVNMLMLNDGENNFSDRAAERNLAIGFQSWTADFQDIDNDGDMDCFITNHDVPSQLLENDGLGNFTDITATAGINIGGLAIQGLLRDFDNDGFVDLLVAGTIEYLYSNNGDGTFTQVPAAFGSDDMESCAVGDLNNDGFLDVIAGYAEVFNNPTFKTDKLWLNQANSNNYLSVLLRGTRSNRGGVGARLELHGPWGIQVREVRAGESYGITNAHEVIFGMASETQAERLYVFWPSGNVDIIEAPNANSTLEIEESDCFGVIGSIDYTGDPVICTGETIELTAPTATSYLWSNGAMTPTIEVSNSGNYWVVLEDSSGCYARTKAVNVRYNPTEEIQVLVDGKQLVCEGESVTLEADTELDYTWSDGSNTTFLEVTQTGDYYAIAEGDCGLFNSDTVRINVLSVPEPPLLENDTINGAGPATLRSSGQLTHWFAEPNGGIPLDTGNVLELPLVNQTTTFYAENASGAFATNAFVGLEEPAGDNRYTSNQINGGLFFEAFAPFNLVSVKVFTDLAGERVIELRDLNDAVITSKLVNLEVGEQRIELDIPVPEGQWFLTTNEGVNLTNFGFLTPRMERSQEGVQYPYEIEDLVQIEGSNFGNTRYYYFFDWEVNQEGTYCPSERLSATVVVEQSTNTSGPSLEKDWTIFPNPAKEVINLYTDRAEGKEVELALYTSAGKKVFQQFYKSVNGKFATSIPIADLPNGVYHLKIRDGITFKNRWVVVLR